MQEQNKIEESSNRWVCGFCGKAFYDERFLDLHFVNRHSSYTRQVRLFGINIQNLYNVCDVMRDVAARIFPITMGTVN